AHTGGVQLVEQVRDVPKAHRRAVDDGVDVRERQTRVVERAYAQVDLRRQDGDGAGRTHQYRQWTFGEALGDEAAEETRAANQQNSLGQEWPTTSRRRSR